MGHFFIPTAGPEGWRSLLADPEKHWRTGYSAKALACCWEEAKGFPHEILNLFLTASNSSLRQVSFLIAFPEWQVSLPGGRRSSQNDLFVLGKAGKELAVIMIEGKVAEPFGPTLGEWLEKESPGRRERLAFLQEQLGLQKVPPNIRYQLIHRAASAVIEAERFGAVVAIMVIHSFSAMHEWFEDFQAFLHPYNVEAAPGQLVFLGTIRGVELYSGWAVGEAKFLEC